MNPDSDTIRQQQSIMDELGIPGSRRHIFLCCDQTKPKCCGREESLEAGGHLKSRLKELGLSERGGIQRTKANCLRGCYGGPFGVGYPEGAGYSSCGPENLDRIIDEHLVGGKIVEDLLVGLHPPSGE